MQSVSVVLVDDHELFREGLRSLLVRQPDVAVVGEASNARAAYAVVDRTNPDVVVMDLTLTGQDGVAAAREVARRNPSTRVLMLTMHDQATYAAEALRAGAAGYALKHQPIDELLEAIRLVASGRRYLSPNLPKRLLEDEDEDQIAADPLRALSVREREVFTLVARGFKNVSIARELCISIKTVETHRSRIHEKLGLHSVADLITFAVRHRLLQP